MSTAPWAYRLLLRCYPRSLRAEFAKDMCLTFAQVLRDCRTPGERRRLWLATIRESVVGGLCERLSSRGGLPRAPVPPTSTPMDTLLQDFRFAARSLRRRPGLVGTVAITLALGIGANTAIFSLIDAVLLHPIPVHQPSAVVTAFHRLNERTPYEAFPYPLSAVRRARPRGSVRRGTRWLPRDGDRCADWRPCRASGDRRSLRELL